MNVHKISDLFSVLEDVPAKSRTAGTVTGANIIDTTLYKGGLEWFISCGNVASGGTLDAKLQESSDSGMSGATDVATGAITQIIAAGTANLQKSVRTFTKRYVRLSTTSAVAAMDYGATFIGQKRNL